MCIRVLNIFLKKDKDGYRALRRVAREGYLEVVGLLLEKVANTEGNSSQLCSIRWTIRGRGAGQ